MPGLQCRALCDAQAIESVLDNGVRRFRARGRRRRIDRFKPHKSLKHIRHPALRFVRQAENLGVGATPAGSHFAAARTGTFALLDADDVAIPGRFQRQVDTLGAG
jgi:hypothetical protein